MPLNIPLFDPPTPIIRDSQENTINILHVMFMFITMHFHHKKKKKSYSGF